jgi:3'(2'),5'-bisphosphate nucleotidase
MPEGDAGVRSGVGAVDEALLQTLVGIAFAAGRAALDIDTQDGNTRGGKAGARLSRETGGGDAKSRARTVILDALAEIAPRVHAVSEGEPLDALPADLGPEFFLVDPVDGAEDGLGVETARGELTVNIALVQDGAPVAGVVFAPGLEQLWAGRPGAAWSASADPRIGVGPSRPIKVRPAPEGGITAVGGARRSPDVDAFLRAYRVAEVRPAGSSLRFCLLAEGSADLLPQLAPSFAWSTAAGDAVLRAAGGRTVTLDGEPLTYGPTPSEGGGSFANPPFVALGSIGLKAPALA